MGFERPGSTCKIVVTFATRKANFDCWELEWTQCWDVTHEMDHGHIPLASCSRTFLCTPTLWKFSSECRHLCNEIDFWCLVSTVGGRSSRIAKRFTTISPSENCIVAMIRGLRQPLTRIGCLQAFGSGPAVEEPCPAEIADCDHVFYDNGTGASLPSKLCEEAMQLEIKYMKEMNASTEP